MIAGLALLTAGAGIVFYPIIKPLYDQYRGKNRQIFLDVTDQASLKRHHMGAPWLASFAASVTDFDGDGSLDIFVNNHERYRPYFYRNLGNGKFNEVHEAIGLWENPIGPVFGKPKVDAPGFYLWLDPQTAIEGTWHLRWQGKPGQSVSGEIISNTPFVLLKTHGFDDKNSVHREADRFHFETRLTAGEQGMDFKSAFPESSLIFNLRFDGAASTQQISIGPHNTHPSSIPFELSLGDRHASVWGDYDNDGRPDLFITRGAMTGKLKPPHGSKHEELFRNENGKRLVNLIETSGIENGYGRGREAQWLDYDNDGKLDLYVSNLGSRNLLFKNLGNGKFVDVAAAANLALTDQTHFVFADFNGDGWTDVLFNQPLRLFINRGGRFTEETVSWGLSGMNSQPHAKDSLFWGANVTVADFDNDGDLDVFAAGGLGKNPSHLLENHGGRFVDITAVAGFSALKEVLAGIWGDFNNDGHIDLYTLSADPASNLLFRNNGNTTFTNDTLAMNLPLTGRYEWALPAQAGGAATWLDYDHDGFLDLFLATRRKQSNTGQLPWLERLPDKAHHFMKGKIAGTHFLLRNTGNGHHWIKIRLVGKTSNRDGYGAKVYVYTEAGQQFREAGADSKIRYAQNQVPMHVGLGQANQVKRIEVIWPSGIRQKLENLPANQLLRIEEPVATR